ncbi:unnamed protein product [Allacma fusca]|uniref:Uncharacterized protein n=1 Tax=Allacma fusca TaxID=39272 RepID=A0A8J2LBZ9_9HEXA|nr:unnamed protein product [Allacma fusca]
MCHSRISSGEINEMLQKTEVSQGVCRTKNLLLVSEKAEAITRDSIVFQNKGKGTEWNSNSGIFLPSVKCTVNAKPLRGAPKS